MKNTKGIAKLRWNLAGKFHGNDREGCIIERIKINYVHSKIFYFNFFFLEQVTGTKHIGQTVSVKI